MRSAETQLSDMSESSTPAASLVVTAVTQARAPAVGDDDEETVILVPFSPPLATASATTPVEPRMEGSVARPSAEALVLVNGSASTSCAVDDTTESSVRAGVPFLVDKKGTEVILGDAPQDFLPSPPPSTATCQPRCAHQNNDDSSSRADGDGDQKADGADDAEVARGNAIQDKYNIKSQEVEKLPRCGLTAFVDDPKCATGCAERRSVAAAERNDKRRRGGDGVKNGPAKGAAGERKRRAQEKAEAAELQTAFKQSQRALRKQAKSVNMRDVFSRTLSLPSPLQIAADTVGSSFSFSCSTSLTDTGINSSSSNGDTSAPAATGVSSPASLRFRSHAFSPTSLVSPPNSTAWSPGLVGELTNRFLAHILQQKRQKFEQMVSRELSQSQALSQTRSLTRHPRQLGGAEDDKGDDNVEHDPHWRTDSAIANGFASPVDELVIGEEDEEAANWMPADPSSPTSQHARRIMQRESVSEDEVVLLGASSSQEGRFPSFSTTPAENRKAEEEEEAKASQEQKEVVRSLARKHEIWKLKQRQMRAQEQVELDERAKMIQLQKSSKAVTTVTSSSSVIVGLARGDAESAPATSSLATSAASAPFFTGFFRPFQAATAGASNRGHSSSDLVPVTARSIQSAKLSAEDISMIRRINNFDNTSTQRVVVFGTAASKQGKDESAQR
ncbi:hypothetical protein LSCM4_01447 [Leishmania orientalis]|uniref:Uncharacterized protein n=1 Tax=Leishmania orientalis TaxID=2249476 RepID=A0A836GWC8_9TRYP|nr:hypothetical protein LSCM4_01447 [Leishmania orientalis]